MAKFLTLDGLTYFYSKLKTVFVSKESGKDLSTNDYTTTDKNKLSGIAVGAEVNVINAIKINGTVLAVTSKSVNIDISGKANVATTLAGYGITNAYTKDEVDSKISSVYKPGGSLAFSSLPTPSATTLGQIYNITDAFTTNTSFVEGSGYNYPAGTNVGIILKDGTYYYDVFSGIVDLSPYMKNADMTAITNAEIDTIVS